MDPAIHDHLRPVEADLPPGVYRVVGSGEELALLRVTDGEGERTSTGEVHHVPADALEGFERADDPDAGFSPVGTILEGLEGIRIAVTEPFR